MATNTINYNLVKPTLNETADIEVINSNMDIIDLKLKENNDKSIEALSSLDEKQNTSDNNLKTTAKTIVGAINELSDGINNTHKIPDGTKYRRYKNSNITSLTSVIDISGSGYLKTALILAEGYTTNEQIKITVDGKLIFGTNVIKLSPVGSKKYAALGLCKNLIGSFMDGSTAYFGADGVEGFIMDKSFNKNLNFPSSTLQSLSDDYGCVYPIGELIKFESSLKIEVKTSKNILVEYYLD